ncbi:tRNA epoxyqueuosine(34) reductase QueG [Endozoicomonas sp. SCSIO W0465]|uniref:tRNA epoxyqueuosine(34) reductase QueG n=1 Tax=Endozoicomonas sp. SCSIO W0465 TaxID=2918516 RepID=UPI00207607C2|nr:tRNA epoxyqueuosine(34) reductase QueG [Endozoicomonas sp. SCSIO W0465]USE37221.1 tRNA epoxyqueuosine(34) reductase QueG [Endozoicomonas sp. SCSIO W0465]
MEQLVENIRTWARELGFQEIGITEAKIPDHDVKHLEAWLDKGYHGDMAYMARHRELRAQPEQLHPGSLRVISARMDYLPADTETVKLLNEPEKAYVSRYALGRDYHKLIRKRLTQLGQQIETAVGEHGYRAFVDSAPVMERPLAQQAGLGWMGKHSLILNRQAGSFFFLGELFTNLPLPVDKPYEKNHCGRCTSCMDKCPTQAIVAPYQVDARRCISYLTIENKGPIPEALRPLMGNRIYGCDDCQLACPWNRFAKPTLEQDFQPRHHLDSSDLVELFNWSEAQFLERTAGSPIRRAGYESWLRNIAVALGNAPGSDSIIIAALKSRLDYPSELVQEHIQWALEQHVAGTN